MSARLINRFGKPHTIWRATLGSYVDGIFIPGNEASFTIKASKQPLTGDEQELLPEGNDSNETFALFTLTKLNIQKDSGGSIVQSADQVEFEGRRYQVISCIPHTDQNGMSISYYKAIAQIVGGEA